MSLELKALPSSLDDQPSPSQDLPRCPHLCLKPPQAPNPLQVKLRVLTEPEALQKPRRPTPVCIRTCRVSWLGFWNVFPQCGQGYVKPLLSMFLLYGLVPATLGSQKESAR